MIESCSGPFSYRDLIWNRKIFLSHWGVLHRGKELGNEKNHCNGTEEYYIRTILLDHAELQYAVPDFHKYKIGKD